MNLKYIGTYSKDLPESLCDGWFKIKDQIATEYKTYGSKEKRFTVEKEKGHFFFHNLKSPSFFFFTKKDLLLYLEYAKEEYWNPSYNYYCKNFLKRRYIKLYNQIRSYKEEYFVFKAYLKYDYGWDYSRKEKVSRAYLQSINENKDTPIYNKFIEPILCTKSANKNNPPINQIEFIKLLDETSDNIYIYMRPLFTKKYTPQEIGTIISNKIQDTPIPELSYAIEQLAIQYSYFFEKESIDRIVQNISINQIQGQFGQFDIRNIFDKAKDTYENFLKESFFHTYKPGASKEDVEELIGGSEQSVDYEFLQKIYYGAPGTGKSQKIKVKTANNDIYRTTFHPDSDYSTFVGAYKPVKDEESGKITYKFIQQCFTKAYVAAWKKYISDVYLIPSSNEPESSITFEVNGESFRLRKVTNDGVVYDKVFAISRSSIKKVWERFWESGEFVATSNTSGEGAQEAAALKMHYLAEESQKDFDKIWENLKDCLSGKAIEAPTPADNSSSSYSLTKADDNTLYCVAKGRNCGRSRLADNFDYDNAKGVAKGIVKLLKKYNESDFKKAWDILTTNCNNPNHSLKDEKGEGNESSSHPFNAKPVYLIIEEINRGNCAQIFGDIFQLLDRNKWGFSEYPIEADQDLAMELKREFEGLYMDDALKNHINGLYEKEYPNGVVKDILAGEKLLFPGNLSILATMNTSDQSLFPMDSAFKRRWTWEYTKIEEAEKDEDKMFIELENDKKEEGEPKTVFIPWIEVVTTINNYIKKQLRSSDKQIGYWFVKSDCEVEIDGKTRKGISMDQFRDKVLFYLFDDAFKDDEDFANLFGSDTYLFVDLLSEQDLTEKVSGVLKEMEK